MSRSVSAISASSLAVAETFSEGSARTFHVLNTSTEVDARLMKSGTYCHIWVDNALYDNTLNVNDDEKLNSTQVNDLAEWFDKIYPAETNLLGHEYGGGLETTDPAYGGKDRDPKISILVYDIDGDYDATQTSGVFGLFSGVDYQDAGLEVTLDGITYTSNGMEMVYIDSFFTDVAPEQMYSTLIHEFQHMINFKTKCIDQSLNVPNWYNEMLSMMAEEVIGTSLVIDSEGLPWESRMGTQVNYYLVYGLDGLWTSSLINYAQSYAFGTYLMHNFGGARVLREMELNSSTGAESVVNAVNAIQGTAVSFADIYRGYPETLLFSAGYETRGKSYYRANFHTWNGVAYNCMPLDIGAVANSGYQGTQDFYSDTDTIYPKTGISFRKFNYVWDLPRYGVSIHSDLRLQNVTGSASITVTAPENPNVEMYILVR